MKINNEAHILLAKHLEELGIRYEREYFFALPKRQWRFDFRLYGIRRLADERIAIEIEGGIWTRGRHVRGKGFQEDIEKYNTATMMGYRVLRFSTQDVLIGRAKKFLQEHLSIAQMQK